MSNPPIIESQDRQALRALLEASYKILFSGGLDLDIEFRLAQHKAYEAICKVDPLTAQLQDAQDAHEEIMQHVRDYHMALNQRENGDLAMHRCVNRIEQSLGLQWEKKA